MICQSLKLVLTRRPILSSYSKYINQHARCISSRKKATNFRKPKAHRKKLENIGIYNQITVRDLAVAMGRDVDHVFECLLFIDTTGKGIDNENSPLSVQVAGEVCVKSGVRAQTIAQPAALRELEEDKDVYRRPEPEPSICKPRPPVVTIMGHVDHGKTTLLDYLRKSDVVDKEFGGITQHIGAFSVKMKDGKSITFLDTPGHAAFDKMRGRGASVTDIVVLVVAADDGVMPQTIESINHAMQSNVPIIVAINKCDRPEAEPQICMEDLSQHGVVLEDVGGDVLGVKISALKGTNVDALQDAIITLSELLETRADYSGLVEGSIVESQTDIGRGKIATMLVQRGTLKKGSWLVCGTSSGKIKSILDENRKQLTVAGPGLAVETTGWKDLPSPGDEVLEVKNESQVKTVLNYRKAKDLKEKSEEDWQEIKQVRDEHKVKHKQQLNVRNELGQKRYNKYVKKAIIEKLGPAEQDQGDEETTPQLPLIIRTDVDGSLEAIQSSLATYTSSLVKMETMASGAGEVTENDIELAQLFDGVIYAFNISISDKVGKLASESGVEIRHHNIIYKLFDDIRDLLNDRVQTQIHQTNLGEAIVQQVFVVTEKIGSKKVKVPVAGCRCNIGLLNRNRLYRVVRNNQTLHVGTLFSLKHFKNEVDEIKQEMECGLALSDHSADIQVGDSVFCYEEKEVKPEIEWDLPF